MAALQTDRRSTPYPWTWEPAAGVTVVVALVAVVGLQLGRALANWTSGAGWTWPRNIFASLDHLLVGDATAGLAMSGQAASPAVLMGWIVAVEGLLLAALVSAAAWMLRRWGPGRLRGMATAAEAEKTLGRSRLRRVRAVIRPDLYPSSSRKRSVRVTSWEPSAPERITWSPGGDT